MDRVENPLLSRLSGQLKLGLVEDYKKESVWEDLVAFARDLLSYSLHRVITLLSYFPRIFVSGFTLTETLKFWLSRKFVRRRGQLSFPFAHATLVGVSLSLLALTTGLGGFIFKNSEPILADLSASILSDNVDTITEESQLLSKSASTYIVQEGDDLYKIASDPFVNRPPDSIVSANDLKEDGKGGYILKVGQVLKVPPLQGSDYTVKDGDTLASIVRKHPGSNAQQIVEFNYIMDLKSDLKPGLKIWVPAEKALLAYSDISVPNGACKIDTKLGYPTSNTTVIGSYNAGHRGIDFPANYEPLFAIGDGRVSAAKNFPSRCMSFGSQCNYGYGGLVFIDLLDSAGNFTGLQARYGHISNTDLREGQMVKKGDVVATSGESGVTFGPHLHFEIYCGSAHQRVNPFLYLGQ